MSNQLIANRYASAIIDEAVAQGKVEEVEKDLRTVDDIVAASPDLRMLLRSPIIENWRKKNVFREVFEKEIGELTLSFLILVIDKNREGVTREIVREFTRQLDTQRNILRVSIASATELDAGSKKQLDGSISEKTGGMTVESTYSVEDDLIGGVKVKIGDLVYDGSLRHQLDALRDRLATA